MTSKAARPRPATSLAKFACGLPVTNSSLPPSLAKRGDSSLSIASRHGPPNVAMRRVTPSKRSSAAAGPMAIARPSSAATMTRGRDITRMGQPFSSSEFRSLPAGAAGPQQGFEPDDALHDEHQGEAEQDDQRRRGEDRGVEILLEPGEDLDRIGRRAWRRQEDRDRHVADRDHEGIERAGREPGHDARQDDPPEGAPRRGAEAESGLLEAAIEALQDHRHRADDIGDGKKAVADGERDEAAGEIDAEQISGRIGELEKGDADDDGGDLQRGAKDRGDQHLAGELAAHQPERRRHAEQDADRGGERRQLEAEADRAELRPRDAPVALERQLGRREVDRAVAGAAAHRSAGDDDHRRIEEEEGGDHDRPDECLAERRLGAGEPEAAVRAGVHAIILRPIRIRRMSRTESRLMKSTATSSTTAKVAAIEYLTSIMIVRWIRTGRVRMRPPPSSAAEVKAPMHMLKIIRPPTVRPGRLSGSSTRRKTRKRLAPWACAASSSERGMVWTTL